MKVGEWEHPTDKGNGQRQHTPINVNNVLTETIVVYISIPGTTLQPQGDEPGQRDIAKNHGRLGGICQTPGYLKKNFAIDMLKETGVQLLCSVSYDRRCTT